MSLQIGIPLFIYPSDQPESQQAKDWQRVIDAAPHLGFVVPNVNSGPGMMRDPDYVRAINRLKANGIPAYGYTATTHGAKPMGDVLADILKWESLWDIKDSFLDEAATGLDQLDKYAVFNARIKGRVIINPGVSPLTPQYLKCADVICNFESSFDNYKTRTFAPWEIAAKDRMWHIIYGVPATSLATVLEKARKTAGYVFVTDDPNPDTAYHHLPTYWERLVAVLKQPSFSSLVSQLIGRLLP